MKARWYQLLLRAFPHGFRADKGDEMLGTLLEDDAGSWRVARQSVSLVWEGMRLRFSPSAEHLRPLVPAIRFGALGWFGFIAAFHLARRVAFASSLADQPAWGWYLAGSGAALLAVPYLRWVPARVVAVVGAVWLLAAVPPAFSPSILDRVTFDLKYLLVPALGVLVVSSRGLRVVPPAAALAGAAASWVLFTGGTSGAYTYLGAYQIGGVVLLVALAAAIGAIVFKRFAAALWIPAVHVSYLLGRATTRGVVMALIAFGGLALLAQRRRYRLVRLP